MNPCTCVRAKVSSVSHAGLDAASPVTIFCIGRWLLFVAGNSPGGDGSPGKVSPPSVIYTLCDNSSNLRELVHLPSRDRKRASRPLKGAKLLSESCAGVSPAANSQRILRMVVSTRQYCMLPFGSQGSQDCDFHSINKS
jgi:hypothetical protein